MTDHWGNGERFVLIGTLFILVALLTIVTNEVAVLADWSDSQAKVIADGFTVVTLFLLYLAIQVQWAINTHLSERVVRVGQALSAVVFLALGIATGRGIDQIAAVGVAALLVIEPAIEAVVQRLPKRWVDHLEASLE